MRKPSPGPWTVGQHMNVNKVLDANGKVIADASDRSSEAGERQRPANAALMAASFELLEALESLLENRDGQIVHRASIERASAVVAKVRGLS